MFRASRFQLSVHEEAFPEWVDTDTSFDLLHTWNLYWCLRIMADTYILCCTSAMGNSSSAHSPELICQEMVDEVCASVPIHIGSLNGKNGSSLSRASGIETLSDAFDKPQGVKFLGAMYLMPFLRWILSWPLTLGPGQLGWVQRQTEKIGAILGNDAVTHS